jgi:hypothetical protein
MGSGRLVYCLFIIDAVLLLPIVEGASSPICQGKLRGEFGYNAETLAARQVLAGTYQFGEDFDEATKRICEALADIRRVVPEDSVEKIITKEIWQKKWKGKKEETSSSVSTLHFGHYISGAHSDQISDFHALKTSLALVHGISLGRWSKGLCVMLEKLMGVRLITKLRAILLMEADFNAMNKIIFGERMMEKVRKYKLMPEEIFSEKNREASDGGMSKKLFWDIARQLKRPVGLASVDAANCYDRVAHAIASMCFQAFGTPPEACNSMLHAIQDMKFFLRTAFGDSKEAVGAKINLKTQGFMQGNGAAPAGWAVVSISIIHAHKKEGHGATFLCPVSKLSHKVAGILYVDDTDIIHLDLSKEETLEEAHMALQASLDSWSQLLIATGGALKPEKCFYYLVSFEWDRLGKWKYAKNESNSELAISVCLPDGSREEIEHLPVDEARITLGMSSCPSGKANDKLAAAKEKADFSELGEMQNKAMDWARKAKDSHLRPRDIHFSIERKFWPKCKYGLCGNNASYDDLTAAMDKPYYLLCPLGGIIRSAKKELRYLDTGFYGVGFPHWGIEAIIESTNKLMTHFGAQSLLGVQYQMSAELLAIEVGMGAQPLLLDYEKYGPWATDCSLKELWARMHRFGFQLQLNTIKLRPPREGDRFFMVAVEAANFPSKEKEIINRVRLHQGVVYESDVFEVDGRHIDERYKRLRKQGERWSEYLFPKQKIPASHLRLWKQVLLQLAPGGRRPTSLGKFVTPSHKIWDFLYDPEYDVVLKRVPEETEGMVLYEKEDGEMRGSGRTKYLPGETVFPSHQMHNCSVKQSADGSVRIRASCPPVQESTTPECFLDVLKDWGCTWMWKDLKITSSIGTGLHSTLTDGGAWLYEAVEDNTLVGVTDGSYIREICPHLCSAAVILECTKGRGRLVLSFPEQCLQANAYRGELLGLMALHLLLLAINKTKPLLEGSVHIYSDCLGALDKVEHLPPHRIPSKCRHSDVLKNIMLHCQEMSFKRIFSHVKAHQDDKLDWEALKHEEQLNCGCDHAAKRCIKETVINGLPKQQAFPLEPLALFVNDQKITTESGPSIRFEAQRQEARRVFEERKVLLPHQFDLVDWPLVHQTLREVPKMFQIFACKQVFDVSATNRFLHKRNAAPNNSPFCNSCTLHEECAGHILCCPEEGRVKMLHKLSEELLDWLDDAGTPRDLTFLIVKYIQGRGESTMAEIVYTHQLPEEYLEFANAQDFIGWRRFLEGMVSAELAKLVRNTGFQEHGKLTADKWGRTLIQKLLEITHGLWIYRNLTIHDSAKGVLAVGRREQLLKEIEKQIELGGDGLAEEDQWMLEVNLGDLDDGSTGEYEVYWLLAITTAREFYRIKTREQRVTA